MDNDQTEDLSSEAYFIPVDFPFVILPTKDFTSADSHTQELDGDDDQTATDFVNENEKNDDEGEKEEIIDDEENESDQKNNLRISQPEYSQLLKGLDFSQARMVDVTDLLSDEAGQYLTADENENLKKLSSDEKYRSLSATSSSASEDHIPLVKATDDIQSDLNHLAAIIRDASQTSTGANDTDEQRGVNMAKKHLFEEDDDTSRQATQNYDLNDNEQEVLTSSSSKLDKNVRLTTQDDNLSSIPRLNTSTTNRTENPVPSISWDNLINGTGVFIPTPSQPINEDHTTPSKQQNLSPSAEKFQQSRNSSSKPKLSYRSRQLSTSSETDSVAEYTYSRLKPNEAQLSADEDLDDLHTHLKEVLLDQPRPYTTASDLLLRRATNQENDRTKKKSHHQRSSTSRHAENVSSETLSSTLDKLEREHKDRLEKQQKQYEDYMQELEEKMKRRFDTYLSTTNSLQESKSDIPNIEKDRPSSYRPLAKEVNLSNGTTVDKRPGSGTNLSRSHSREDISSLRTELSTKHAKHITDLKLYYEHELEELKGQLTLSKMGHTSSATRQSIETIERINNENIRLHEQLKDLRPSLKTTEEENHSLKRQLEDSREQLNRKDLELKIAHRTMTEMEQQLTEAQHNKERHEEKFRQADRQALFHREENEKITTDLNLTRERLVRLDERCRDLENENKTIRQQLSSHDNHNTYQRHPITDDHKLNSTMSLNTPTSREYGRFTLTTSRYSSSTVNTSKDIHLDSGRYTSNSSDKFSHQGTSPRSSVKIIDHINDRPPFPQTYVPPSRSHYSPEKSSSNHHQQMPVRDLVDEQIKQGEQLEAKFDDLLKKKRDLESRINRIPTRGLTNTDRQLLEVLEREIERVEQQISSVKLELRKMNILRTY